MEIQHLGLIVFVIIIVAWYYNFLRTIQNKKDVGFDPLINKATNIFKEKNNQLKGSDEFEIIDNNNQTIVDLSQNKANPNCSTGIIIATILSISVITGFGIIIWILGIFYLSYEKSKGKYNPECWKIISIILWLPVIVLLLGFGGCLVLFLTGH